MWSESKKERRKVVKCGQSFFEVAIEISCNKVSLYTYLHFPGLDSLMDQKFFPKISLSESQINENSIALSKWLWPHSVPAAKGQLISKENFLVLI